MSNQDIPGNTPIDEAPGAPAGTPEYFEQQLAKEREARALMRDRLRHTEALAAESHALRARMAQELERVTADRDRLRTAAATAPTQSAVPDDTAPLPRPDKTARAAKVEPPEAPPPMTPRFADMPLRPPRPTRRGGPWGALAMLGVVAVVVGAVAWFSGSPSVMARLGFDTASSSDTPADNTSTATTAAAASPAPTSTRLPAPTAASVLAGGPSTTAATATTAGPSGGATPLPPLTPEAQLAAAPTAAGPTPAIAQTTAAPTSTPSPAPAGMATRLRAALDGEGIASPVDVDAATGHVTVADPQADAALRSRTDMLIRAVYAGASLPEPQIEHRWMSPMRGSHPEPVAAAAPAPAYAARHAAVDAQDAASARRRKADVAATSDIDALRPVLPEGRVTAGCRDDLAGRSVHRADMTACMKHSCCSSAANHNSEECRAYDKAYPFTCGA